jgi:hypothetical protein
LRWIDAVHAYWRCNLLNIWSVRIAQIDKRVLRKASSISIIRGSLNFERR